MKKSEIIKTVRQAKKLAKTKTEDELEDELFEIIGKEKIPFKYKFKPGDIICSDRFHNKSCMIVEKFNTGDIWEDNFTCQDLIEDHQKWRAYEFDTIFNKPCNWRIATDDDIANYLSRFLDIPLGKVGQFYLAKFTDDGIILTSEVSESIHLDANELADLKRIIDERLG
jgi:hypothetical protein